MKRKILLLVIFLVISFAVIIVPNDYIYAEEVETNNVTLKYNANGGKKAPKSVVAEVNSAVEISADKPSRTNYKFLGWSTDKKAKEATYKKGQTVTLEDNLTLYAVWGKKVTVYFNANGGKASKRIKMYQGTNYTKVYTPKRKGYKFLGWYTKKSGGKLVDKDTLITKTRNHTLYAQWKKITYTIEYELNGGTNNTKNKEKYNITTKTLVLKNPTKKGYTFKGWYSDSKFKKKVTRITKGSTGNKVFYAKWSANKYTILFDGNGAKNVKSYKQTIKYDKEVTLTKNKFTKSGKVFSGWSKEKNKEVVYTDQELVKNLTAKNNKTITLYAKWDNKTNEAVEFTVEEKEFIEGAKEIYKAAQTQFVTDSIIESMEREYTSLEGTPEGYTFLVNLSDVGKITRYYVTNGTYQFVYEGTDLNLTDITAVTVSSLNNESKVPTLIEKYNFVEGAKEIYKAAQTKFVTDSIIESGEKEYTTLNNSPIGFEFLIKLNSVGAVTKYYVTNGNYQFKYDGEGLVLANIEAVSTEGLSGDELVTFD